MKKILAIVVALAGMAFALPAFASTLYIQANATSTTPDSTALGTSISGGAYVKFQKLGTGLSGTVATTTVYMQATASLANMTAGVRLQCYDDAYVTLNTGCSSSVVTRVLTQGAGMSTFDFATPVTLSPSKYYALGIGCNSSCSGGTNSNLRTKGSATDLYAGGDFSTGLTITDLYFVITGTYQGATTIVIASPADGSSGSDFVSWGLNLAGSPVSGSRVTVDYYLVSGGTGIADWEDQATWSATSPLTGFSVLKHRLLYDASSTAGIVYQAVAGITSPDGTVLATSTTSTFTVNAVVPFNYNAGIISGYAYSTTTANFQYGNVDCTIVTGWFDVPTGEGWNCIFRKAGSWLVQLIFIPSDTSMGFLKSSFANIQQVFPFNFIIGLKTELMNDANGFAASTTTSYINIYLPANNFNATSTDTLTLLSTHTLDDFWGQEWTDRIMNAMLLVALIAFVFFAIDLIGGAGSGAEDSYERGTQIGQEVDINRQRDKRR